ncbi:MAG: hypothetical protein EOS75_30075 [Mesorhizobium sp.]|nr:MAG: hypothetical protein EOS74_10730 [Mesorhizobium sp.]RWD52224.1 MAG: hypothetical protein EOS75_30075 [Mesorhizobium sp.]
MVPHKICSRGGAAACISIVASLCMLLFMIEVSSADDYVDFTKPYCALPIAEAAGLERIKTKQIGSLSNRWPTKTIPYVIDPLITDIALKRGVRNAAEAMRKYYGLKFRECDGAYVETKKSTITSYIFVTEQTSGDDKECSANVVGYAPTAARLKEMFSTLKSKFPIRGNVIRVGNLICSGNTWIGIVHEFMHALGLEHEQSHPAATQYIKINVSAIKSPICYLQFRPLLASPPWTELYNPASVLHYDQLACGDQDEMDFDFLPAAKKFEATNILCGYKADSIPTGKCFALSSLNPSVSTDLSECISVYDQERVSVTYDTVPDDKFSIGSLDSTETCINPEKLN